MNYLIVTAMVISGIASQYSPGTMERVAKVREGQGYEVDWTVEHVAVVDCNEVGEFRQVRYRNNDGQWEPWQQVQVIDCAMPGDGTEEWMEENEILLEMGYEEARGLGMVGRGVDMEMIVEGIVESERCRGKRS